MEEKIFFLRLKEWQYVLILVLLAVLIYIAFSYFALQFLNID